jgi:chromosomal replication initiation ATPase DnaA
MARPLRIEYPGAYYHVINRGNNQEKISKDKAREVAIYLARDMTGITCNGLGEYFGGVSGAIITMVHNRIADESKKNKRLKGRIDNIRNQIFKI